MSKKLKELISILDNERIDVNIYSDYGKTLRTLAESRAMQKSLQKYLLKNLSEITGRPLEELHNEFLNDFLHPELADEYAELLSTYGEKRPDSGE